MIKKLQSPVELNELQKRLTRDNRSEKPTISVCGGTGCHGCGCERVHTAFLDEIDRLGIADKVGLKLTGCHGLCECGTLVTIHPQEIFYIRVNPQDVTEILTETILKDVVIDSLLYFDPDSGQTVRHEHDVPFYKKQRRLIFGSNGLLDPDRKSVV